MISYKNVTYVGLYTAVNAFVHGQDTSTTKCFLQMSHVYSLKSLSAFVHSQVTSRTKCFLTNVQFDSHAFTVV